MTFLRRCYKVLWITCDPRPWWRREIWDPALEPKIPRRPHEPVGRASLYFHQLEPPWLRLGMQWWFKTSLETGQLTWTTVQGHRFALQAFAEWMNLRDPMPPWLCEEPAEVRGLMLDFLSYVQQLTARRGRNIGKPLSPGRVKNVLTAVESFYAFMHDYQEPAAAAWTSPAGYDSARSTRCCGERATKAAALSRDSDSRSLITLHSPRSWPTFTFSAPQPKTAASQTSRPCESSSSSPEQGAGSARSSCSIATPCCRLSSPRGPMRKMADSSPSCGISRRRSSKPRTSCWSMPRSSRSLPSSNAGWISTWPQWRPGVRPVYLFLAANVNRNADRYYPPGRLWHVLSEFVRQLGIHDAAGRLIDFNRTHRFRHTKATSLLNADVPLHVVQRYMGHLSPTMTMNYAQTLAATHEAELRRRVEQLRAQQRATPPPGPDKPDPDQPSSVIRTLTSQLTDLKRRHREETAQLRQALEAAHGEIIDLRRRLGPRAATPPREQQLSGPGSPARQEAT